MLTKELAKKIDELIYEKFPIIYEYDFDGIVLTWGGSIRNTVMNTSIKDLDFVILTQGECEILKFIKKYNLKYKKNIFNNYKIFYNGISIDMFSTNDLIDATVYDIDLLFYDIKKHEFIDMGAIRAIEKRTITHINNGPKVNYANKMRERKIIEFIKFITDSNKRVKIKKNRLLWLLKSFVWKIKINFNKLLNSNIRKCFRFLNKCKKEFYLIIILGGILSLLYCALPAILGIMISNLLDINYKNIIILISIFLLLRLIIFIFHFIMSKIYLIINKSMVNNIRKTITDCVLSLDMNNFISNNRGNFIDKLKSDPNEITKNFNAIKDIIIGCIGNFGVMIYIFLLDYRIGLLLFIFIIISFLIRKKGIDKRRKYMNEYYYNQEKYSSLLGEMLNGVSDIKNLNLKDNYIKKTVSSFKDVSEMQFVGNYYLIFYNKIASIIELFAIVIVFFAGLLLVKNNYLSVSSLIIMFMYNSSVFSFMDRLGTLMNLVTELNISCDRIFTLIDNDLYFNEVFGNYYKNNCKGVIEFKNVKFKYDSKNPYVLDDCSFSVDSNSIFAIVGKSGEGKTTILNLISRLYSADCGTITIDRIDIREYSEKYIRDNISVISQNPYLFDMSIKDNLRLVKENITDKEIIDVCKLVCLDEFIETLPNKYDTVIGEGGIKLSGGQKQRLGIARALIKNTKIILLDEITSALDNETGSIIKKVINNIKKKHTVIVVTHELSMIEEADRILVLDNGKIVGDGKHQDLLKNNKIYKKLYKIK